MQRTTLCLWNLLFLAVVLLSACSKEEPQPEPPKPWQELEIMPGNFTVNSKDIVTHQSSAEPNMNEEGADLYKDYVKRTDLPSNAFEYYTIRAYIPTVSNIYTVHVNGHGGSLYYHGDNNVRITADNSSGFIETTNMNGVEYSVFEIVVRDINNAMNQANFEKIVFVMNVEYKDKASGALKDQSLVNIEIFADTESSPSVNSGMVTFWINQDYGCGYINVSIPDYGTQTITQYIPSGSPSCDRQGSANYYDLPQGTYSYEAYGEGGCYWTNTFTINSNCSTIQLTL